jgi:hypothetical protein
MQDKPQSSKRPDTPDDKPHGDAGGTRTPAGSTYGDFHPTRRHERPGEPYEDDDQVVPPSPVPGGGTTPPTPRT